MLKSFSSTEVSEMMEYISKPNESHNLNLLDILCKFVDINTRMSIQELESFII